MLLLSRIETPLGPMMLVHDAAGKLWACEFHSDPARLALSLKRFGLGPVADGLKPAPAALALAFESYFSGDMRAFDGIVLPDYGSPFERAVWAVLRTIPAGQTASYGDIARAMGGVATGQGGLARAVGTANGRNPRAIVVPCHRVIGSDGSLTGYAGGLERKEWLLRHEGWRPVQESLI
jgi:methylated-DNA-[protein]-cysteine S-methyltransferase